ncbi:complex I subunit 4 family protein [Acidisarcina polymorpha]|uniref:complex I subunit 4 family protein n=1 Tax=Acidisarcina polymorpha TaxID=2211140 RepID=UPI001F4738E5|nr:NADH-quinone oxidoreductase subunit M [Acidisarcina polymorpha]
MNDSILTWITLLPAAGAVVVALLPRRGQVIQWFTLLVMLATLGLALHLPAHFVPGQGGFQFEVNRAWIASPNIHYHLGVDGISVWLVVLTAFLGPLAVFASWKAIATRTKEFYFLLLLQWTAMIGVFVSLDLFLYYGFWELSLVPMAIAIAMFGRDRGPQAALKFFVYTFLPSALFLVAILWLYAKTGSFDFVVLQQALASGNLGATPQALTWVALAFLVAFAVKVPVFPLHGWLGDVISEAPTGMAMVVAGKLGLYSILRFNLGLFPAQAKQFAPWMIALAVIGLLYGALVALVQKDLKRLAAYSTMSGLSFCTLGIFSFAIAGIDGSIYQILSHEISGSALLVLLGILYERFGTYDIASYGGLAAKMPRYATLFVVTSLSLIGWPILNGFVGEFLVLSSSYGVHAGWGAAATIGVILSAAYMLWMVQRVFYGPTSSLVAGKGSPDLLFREAIALWPVAVLMFIMGVASPAWIRLIDPTVTALVGTIERAPSPSSFPRTVAAQTIPGGEKR